mmetsp:Transcript_9584/g.43656  ORF Transcript_9584/g.43656 Transcript_9584/m.43656 type:complete len:216 (-) Transcript_9584:1155-1802(-)
MPPGGTQLILHLLTPVLPGGGVEGAPRSSPRRLHLPLSLRRQLRRVLLLLPLLPLRPDRVVRSLPRQLPQLQLHHVPGVVQHDAVATHRGPIVVALGGHRGASLGGGDVDGALRPRAVHHSRGCHPHVPAPRGSLHQRGQHVLRSLQRPLLPELFRLSLRLPHLSEDRLVVLAVVHRLGLKPLHLPQVRRELVSHRGRGSRPRHRRGRRSFTVQL